MHILKKTIISGSCTIFCSPVEINKSCKCFRTLDTNLRTRWFENSKYGLDGKQEIKVS